jgi:UDP-GlcNAc:undecaprenyl-phosphate/decaprenyl-phosphate GlcNAc-1-phosphate transferase
LILQFVLFPFLAFALVVVTMPLFIKAARRFHLYDEPDESRKLHTGNIPFIGGICFSLVFILVVLLMVWFDGIEIASAQYQKTATMSVYIAEAAFIILLLGFLDDFRDLPFTRKFIFQFFATFFLILGAIRSGVFPKVFDVQNSSIFWNSVGTSISVFWFVGLTNAVNMIDGMDGLAGGTALISAIAMVVLAIFWGNLVLALALLILIGSVAGFLAYNLPPAKIFMGDTGSMFLGFILGIASWLIVDSAPVNMISIFIPIVILGLPITDTTLAFVRRVIRGQNPFSADRFHIHHMLKARFDLSTRATVYSLLGINVILGAGGILIAMVPPHIGWVIVALLIAGMLGFLFLLGYSHLVFTPKAAENPLTDPQPKRNGHAMRANGSGSAHPAVQTGIRKAP